MQLSDEVKRLLFRLDKTPENFTRRILFMSMFNDISCGTTDNETECLANAKLVSLYARRFGRGQWSFIGLGSEKKVVLRIPSRENGETRCDGTMKFLTRAKSDQDRCAFG